MPVVLFQGCLFLILIDFRSLRPGRAVKALVVIWSQSGCPWRILNHADMLSLLASLIIDPPPHLVPHICSKCEICRQGVRVVIQLYQYHSAHCAHAASRGADADSDRRAGEEARSWLGERGGGMGGFTTSWTAALLVLAFKCYVFVQAVKLHIRKEILFSMSLHVATCVAVAVKQNPSSKK